MMASPELVNTAELIISGAVLLVLPVIAISFRKIVFLPREMQIVKAALFRILRSNKIQGVALTTIAKCQKDQACDGNTDEAIAAVKTDQDKIDDFLRAAALGKVDPLDEVLK